MRLLFALILVSVGAVEFLLEVDQQPYKRFVNTTRITHRAFDVYLTEQTVGVFSAVVQSHITPYRQTLPGTIGPQQHVCFSVPIQRLPVVHSTRACLKQV